MLGVSIVTRFAYLNNSLDEKCSLAEWLSVRKMAKNFKRLKCLFQPALEHFQKLHLDLKNHRPECQKEIIESHPTNAIHIVAAFYFIFIVFYKIKQLS